MLVLATLLFVFVLVRPQITGMVAGETNQTTLLIDKIFKESSELDVSLEGNLTSLAVSGSYSGEKVEIYLDELLVYSSSAGSKNLITGNVIGSENTTVPVNGSELQPNSTVQQVSSTNTSGANETYAPEVNASDDNTNVSDTQNNLTNVNQAQTSVNTTVIENATGNVTQDVINTSVNHTQVNETPITNESTTYNITESTTPSITEGTNESITQNITESYITLSFSEECEETCILDNYPSNATLRIVLDNATLNLSSITYTYLQFNEANIALNLTENLTTELNATQNITTNASIFNVTENITYEEFNHTQVKVGEPVTWSKRVKDVKTVTLPGSAYNIRTDEDVKVNIGDRKISVEEFSRLKSGKPREIKLELNATKEVQITYQTPGPEKSEREKNKYKKQVTISSDIHYKDILASTEIEESPRESITVYWLKDAGKEKVHDIKYIDSNNNNLIGMLEWTVPHLSNQTYEISITILNPYTYLRDGETWTVAFNTTGTANLTISSPNAGWTEFLTDNESTFDEMEFLDLKCGEESLKDELKVFGFDDQTYDYTDLTEMDSLNVEKLLVGNYECNETGYLSNYMHKAGYATLLFEFENQNQSVMDWAYDPNVEFTEWVTTPALTPLDRNTFVVGWCDASDRELKFSIYDTNGTAKNSSVTVYTEKDMDCEYTPVGLTAFNSTHFVIGWYEKDPADTTFAVYDSNGNEKVSPVDVDTEVGSSYSVSVSALNSTHFVIGWYDDFDGDATFAVYDSNGNEKVSPVDVDTEVGSSYSVSVSALNSTRFVIGWHDAWDHDMTFAVYDSSGNEKVSPVDVDTEVGYSYSVSVSALNSTHFVIGWLDMNDKDTTFAVYDSSGNEKVSPVDVDTSNDADESVSVSALNSTHFVIGWYDDFDGDATFAVYDSSGNLKAGPLDSSTSPVRAEQAVSSKQVANNIGICNQNFIHAFYVHSSGEWTSYYPNGTVWDGTCQNAAPTISTPTFSPTTAYITDDIDCNASPTDSENTTLTVEYFWYNRTGDVVVSGNKTGLTNGANAVISTLGSGNTSEGDTLNCTVRSFDGTSYSNFASKSIAIRNGTKANYSKFNSSTTNLDSVNIESVNNLTLEIRTHGKIKWHNSINASGADLDSYVNISDNLISVDSSNLHSSFNSAANLTLYNLGFYEPVILKNSNLCTDCSQIDYSNGNLTFNVTGFTSYSATDNATLIIWDGADSEGGSNSYTINEQVPFYANYTLKNGSIVEDGNCTIQIDQEYNMSFNGSSMLYEFNRSFNSKGLLFYNVSCNSSRALNISGKDNTTIQNSAPTQDKPYITPADPYTTNNLTCNWNNTHDADGDLVVNITNWYKDNKSITVLYMPFEDGSRLSTPKDYSISSNNGIISGVDNEPEWNSTHGKVGGAFKFDGESDKITVFDDASLNFSGSFSISFWSKWDSSTSTTRKIVYKRLSEGYGTYLGVSGVILTFIENQTGEASGVSSSPDAIDDGKWYHYTFVRDNAKGQIHSYLNGIHKDNDTSPGGAIGTTQPLYIGQELNGTIDELRIYNMSLTAEQVWAEYMAGINNHTVNIIAYNHTTVGENWKCEVTPTDGYSDGNAINSSSIIIEKAAPTQGSPYITPVETGIGDNLTCNWNNTQDADGDKVINITNWYKNNKSTMVLYMPFEGGSNSTYTKDYSGYGNDGTVTSATWNRTGGKVGGGYEFDSNGFINISSSPVLNPTSAITIESWIYMDSINNATQYNRVLIKEGQYRIYQDNSGSSISSYINTSNGEDWCTFTNWENVSLNKWYHLVMTYDSNSGNIKSYRNGVLNATCAHSGTLTVTSNNLFIGGKNEEQRFNGSIDEVSIYNYSLSAEQIRANYQAGIENHTPNVIVSQETSLGENWKCEVTPNDGYVDGNILNSSEKEIENVAPEITTPTFSPTTAYTNNDISCNATPTDAENETLTVEYFWYNSTGNVVVSGNKTGLSNGTNIVISTLGSGNTSEGETWNCTIRSFDGTSYSEFKSNTINVDNSAPNVTTPLLSPNTIFSNNDTKANTTYSDIDSDSGTVYFQWYVDNVNVWNDTYLSVSEGGVVNSTIDSINYTRGQKINVSVYADDGTNDSSVKWSSTKTVQNVAPSIDTPVLTSSPSTTSDIECSATPSDLENTTLTVEYMWYNWTGSEYDFVLGDNNTGLSNGTNQLITTLGSGNTSLEDKWNCSVRTFDGDDYSGWKSAEVTTHNSAPEIINATDNASTLSPGDKIKFTSHWSDSDSGQNIRLLISTDSTFSNCNYTEQSGCLAYSSPDSTSPTEAEYTAQQGDSTVEWYAQVCDEEGSCDTLLIKDFSDLSNKNAFEKNGIPSNPSDYDNEANSSEYDEISSDNEIRWMTSFDDFGDGYNSQIFVFDLDAVPVVLNTSWSGYGESSTGHITNLSIFNWTSSSWQELDNKDYTSEDDSSLTGDIQSGIDDYHNSTLALMVTSKKVDPCQPYTSNGDGTCLHEYLINDYDAQAWKGQTTNDGQFDGNHNELASSEYEKISNSTSGDAGMIIWPGSFHAYIHANFTINESPSSINWINTSWKIYSDIVTPDYRMLNDKSLWVKESDTWVEKDYGNSSGYETLNTTYTSGFSSIISEGILEIGSQNDIPEPLDGIDFNVFYVDLFVNYNSSITSSLYTDYIKLETNAMGQFDVNEAPEITTPTFSPTTADTTDDINCNATPTDAENETLTVEYFWYNGTELMLSGNTSGLTNNTNSVITTLGSGNTTKGETWNCTVRTFDGNDYSDFESAEISIGNAPPQMQTSRISPESPVTTDDLLGYCNATDPDGDNVTYSWKWYLDGEVNSSGSDNLSEWCFQEFANESTSCGGLDSGLYLDSGNAYSNAYDGNYSTGSEGSDKYNLLVNYSKPNRSSNNSLLQVVCNNMGYQWNNYTLDQDCWSEQNIQIRVSGSALGMGDVECFNGAEWTGNYFSCAGMAATITEEAMWWYIEGESHEQAQEINLDNISSLQTQKHQNWTLSCMANDGSLNSSWLNSSDVTIGNSPPTIDLLTPTNANTSIRERKPEFTWSGNDNDGDTLNYTIWVSENSDLSSPNITAQTQDQNYTATSNLALDTQYFWKVEVYDGESRTNSSTWNFTTESYIEVKFINESISFGSMNLSQTKNTTSDSPYPFVLQNMGNVLVNVTFGVTGAFWDSALAPLDTRFLQFKADERTEANSFDYAQSQTTWMNLSTENKTLVKDMNYSDSNDEVVVDIMIRVPEDEPAGSKSTNFVIEIT